MSGELLSSWKSSWSEIWSPLADSSCAPADLFSELVSHIATPPKAPEQPPVFPPDAYNEAGELSDPTAIQRRDEFELLQLHYRQHRDRYETAISGDGARIFFKSLLSNVESEKRAVEFLQKAYTALQVFEDDNLVVRYCDLVSKFLRKFNIRYELGENFSLHTTMQGMFSTLIGELHRVSAHDDHLLELLGEFEEAFGDLKAKRTSAAMKTCLQKQFCFIEALASKYPGVKQDTLGKICDELDWPHETIKQIGKKLYGFRSNYPGMGHAGNAGGQLRRIGMKDFVSISLMLAAFTPYVAHDLDPERCYSA